MSEHGTYTGATVYAGVATGTVGGAAVGILGETKGVAGFIAMFMWFVVAVGSSIACMQWLATNEFHGFFPWFFLGAALFGFFKTFQIAFGFVKRLVGALGFSLK